MKYYLLDRANNAWSKETYTLEELSHHDGSSVLAAEDGSKTLTLAEAKASAAVAAPAGKVKMFTSSRPTATSSGKKEYKVLSQKDKWYSGKFDPELLEKALNDYADMGYQVVCSSTASIPGFTGTREEMIIIMERDKK